MAVMLQGGCRVSDMWEGEPFVSGTVRIWNQIGRATGAQAISLRVMEFAPGLSPGIRNDACDEILYVLERGEGLGNPASDEVSTTCRSGSVRLLVDGVGYDIKPATGIYIRPKQTIAINNPGPDSITIVSSQCPDPDREPVFVEAPNNSSTPSTDRTPAVRLVDQKTQPTGDRWYRVLVDDEVGSEQVTQFVGSIPPGRAPDHFHNYEEVLFILKGEGRMWAGETNTPIAPGSCIYLPKGLVHCVENTGEDELRLLGVFYPAGSPSVRYDV